MWAAVQQTIQTGTRVLDGQLTAREGATILATLARDATALAASQREAEPQQAATYQELLSVIADELRALEARSDEPRHLRAVIEDLETVRGALG